MGKSAHSAKWKKTLLVCVAVILSFALVVMPATTVIIYESIFSFRYETPSWLRYSASDFEGLTVQRSDFVSNDGALLAGYCYARPGAETKGVVVFAHGHGGGGHNAYMPIIDYLTTRGYLVFAYDAHGNDNSAGDDTVGLPQGVIDLDYAIRHIKSLDAYAGLPILLLGHSWGAYSAASVLSMHSDVQAAVLISGFNESEDLLLHQSRQYVGVLADITASYVFLYEELKFGSHYADASALQGISDSSAKVLVVHSRDDTNVPIEYGYGKLQAAFGQTDRVEFIQYESRGHGYVFCSDDAIRYQAALAAQYADYVDANGGDDNARVKETFMLSNMDKDRFFELDMALMERIVAFYDEVCL